MRKKIAVMSLLLVGVAGVAFARDDTATAIRKLRETFPNYAFQEVLPSPIPGLYEVVSDRHSVYFSPGSGHLLFGEIWDRNGKNLTAVSQEQRVAKILNDLPLEKAVKIGNGKHTVIEVTDPDCPYCRRGSEYLDSRNDVTRYVFFFPLKNHPEAPAKSRYVLGAASREPAYHEVMKGKFDGKPLPDSSPETEQLLRDHQQVAARLRVSGTPKYWINGAPVSGADIKQIEALLR